MKGKMIPESCGALTGLTFKVGMEVEVGAADEEEVTLLLKGVGTAVVTPSEEGGGALKVKLFKVVIGMVPVFLLLLMFLGTDTTSEEGDGVFIVTGKVMLG